MDERIHIVVDRQEKQRFRRVAARQGQTLSEWLREAAREKLAAAETVGSLDSPDALRAFFDSLDESGTEPDWEQHRAVIDASRARGQPDA